MATPLLLPTNEFEPLLALALQQPAEVLRGGGRYGNFSSTDFRRALGFYAERFRVGDAPGLSRTRENPEIDKFANHASNWCKQ